MAKITLYGIPNCDSVKKARAHLAEHGIDYVFHDYKKQGVPESELQRWISLKGLDTVLNRKGATWRGLSDAEKAAVVNDQSAIKLMLALPSTIKRPIITSGETVIVGVDVDAMNMLMAR